MVAIVVSLNPFESGQFSISFALMPGGEVLHVLIPLNQGNSVFPSNLWLFRYAAGLNPFESGQFSISEQGPGTMRDLAS